MVNTECSTDSRKATLVPVMAEDEAAPLWESSIHSTVVFSRATSNVLALPPTTTIRASGCKATSDAWMPGALPAVPNRLSGAPLEVRRTTHPGLGSSPAWPVCR
jgi:hypothetical protein